MSRRMAQGAWRSFTSRRQPCAKARAAISARVTSTVAKKVRITPTSWIVSPTGGGFHQASIQMKKPQLAIPPMVQAIVRQAGQPHGSKAAGAASQIRYHGRKYTVATRMKM